MLGGLNEVLHKYSVNVSYMTTVKNGLIILPGSLFPHENILRNNLFYALLKRDLVLYFKAEAKIITS